MLNTWHLTHKASDECEDSRIWHGEKLYTRTKHYSCNLYRTFTFLIYYIAFPLLLKSYNFQQYYIRKYF